MKLTRLLDHPYINIQNFSNKFWQTKSPNYYDEVEKISFSDINGKLFPYFGINHDPQFSICLGILREYYTRPQLVL